MADAEQGKARQASISRPGDFKVLHRHKGKGHKAKKGSIRKLEDSKVFHIHREKEYKATYRLILAVEAGDAYKARTQLEDNADPNKFPVLMKAVRYRKTDMVKLLLENGADPNKMHPFNNCKDRRGSFFVFRNRCTVLEKAVENGDFDMVKILLEHGADPNGHGALSMAAENGHGGIVNLLLAYEADPNKHFVLRRAARNGHTDIVKLLLDKGADPNKPLVLPRAAGNGHTDIVKLLLDKGADPNKHGALSMAAKNGHKGIVNLLLDKEADPKEQWVLSNAAKNGHKDIVNLLLEKGADPKKGQALAMAAANGHIDIVKLLLDKGVDPNKHWVLFNAAKNGHKDIVNLMLDKGADPNKNQALVMAAANGHTDIVKLLLDKGIYPNKDQALVMAAKNGHTDIVKLLLDKGVDPNKIAGSSFTEDPEDSEDIPSSKKRHLPVAGSSFTKDLEDYEDISSSKKRHLPVAGSSFTKDPEDSEDIPSSKKRHLPVAGSSFTKDLEDYEDISSSKKRHLPVAGSSFTEDQEDSEDIPGAKKRLLPVAGFSFTKDLEDYEDISSSKKRHLPVPGSLFNKGQHDSEDIPSAKKRPFPVEGSSFTKDQDDSEDIPSAKKRLLPIPMSKRISGRNKITSETEVHAKRTPEKKADMSETEQMIEIVKKQNLEEFKALEKKSTSTSVNLPLIVAVYGCSEMIECMANWEGIQWDEQSEIAEVISGEMLELRVSSATALCIATIMDKPQMVVSLIKHAGEDNIRCCYQHIKLNKTMEGVFMRDRVGKLERKHRDLQPVVVPGHRISKERERERVFLVYSSGVMRPSSYPLDGLGLVLIRNPYFLTREMKPDPEKKIGVLYDDNTKAQEALRIYRDNLWKNHSNLNVIRIHSVSYRNNDQETNSKPCVVLYCSTKGVVPLDEPDFPKKLELDEHNSIDVFVREGYFQSSAGYESSPSNAFHTTLKMGCEIGRLKPPQDQENLSGTLGPFVRFDDDIGFLTCAHVLFEIPTDTKSLNFQDGTADKIEVAQPSSDTQPTIKKACGDVKKAIFNPTLDPSIDVAVVRLTDSERIPTAGRFANASQRKLKNAGFDDLPEYNSGSWEPRLKAFSVSHIAYKFGSSSDITKGMVDTNGTDVRELSTDISLPGRAKKIFMKNQCTISGTHPEFTLCGDSGAPVFMRKAGTNELSCIGMVVGKGCLAVDEETRNYPVAVFTPIESIMNALGDDYKIASFNPGNFENVQP